MITKKLKFYGRTKAGKRFLFEVLEKDFVDFMQKRVRDLSGFLEDFNDEKDGLHLYYALKDNDIPVRFRLLKEK